MTQLTFVCALGAVGGAILLWYGIRSLARTFAARELAVLRVAAEQTVAIGAPGDVILALRDELLSGRFRGVSFALRDARTNAQMPGRPMIVRAQRTSLSGITTLAVSRFAIARPGTFVLAVSGLHPATDYAEARLVLERAQGAAIVLRVLWIVGAAVLTLLALSFGLLGATGVIGGP